MRNLCQGLFVNEKKKVIFHFKNIHELYVIDYDVTLP